MQNSHTHTHFFAPMFRVSTRNRTNDSPHDHLQYGTRNGWCGIATATTIVRIWSELDRRRTRNNVLIGLVTDHFVVRGESQRCHDRHRGRTTLSICRHTNDSGGYDAMSQCISDERERVLVNKGDVCKTKSTFLYWSQRTMYSLHLCFKFHWSAGIWIVGWVLWWWHWV